MIVLKTILIAAAGVVLMLVICPPASCDIYRYKDEKGVWHFSNIKSNSRYKPYLSRSVKRRRSHTPEKDVVRYDPLIQKASKKFNVDHFFIKAIIKAESDFDSMAVSNKGAQGLMQLMPETADDMEVKDPFDPEENIFGGTRYVSLLLKRFNNDKALALAAYNAGPEVVESRNGIPPFPETRTFVKRVMNYYQAYNGRAR